MGQATVSPDPLDEVSTTSIASADDLLAQLAGEEIDRLLAESEAERAATAGERAEGAGGAAPPTIVPPAAPQRPDSRSELRTADEPAVTMAPLQTTPAPQVPTPPGPAAPVAAIAAVASPPVEKRDLTPDDTAAAERAALNQTLNAADTPVAPVDVEPAADEQQPLPQPLPLFLRPLEWLNAPVASCPEAVRETLGKVAIVTLVNAIAVLAYVLMFRGRH